MRQLQQDTLCADLVPGGSETSVEVAAGSSATVASWQDAGPIYVAAAAEVGISPGSWIINPGLHQNSTHAFPDWNQQ